MSKTTIPKLEGKAWSTFLEVELAPQTKILYSRWIKIFMDHCKLKEPDKLLEMGTVHQIEGKVIEWPDEVNREKIEIDIAIRDATILNQ